ncbi:histidine phosphatase family protein [Brevibacillus invocatus]|uniref:histidine phosphatase family protein n=1 Tax=Brevibacillus invocatus TaxID=173959 RepID=UPI0030B8261B
MDIFLVRHCQAHGQETDAPLTETGREQAYHLAEFLQKKEIGLIISSPFLRARQSVQPLAEQLGLSVAVDERLGERILCAENHPDWRDMLEKTFDDLDLCYPGGESSREAMHRAHSVIQEVIASSSANTDSRLMEICSPCCSSTTMTAWALRNGRGLPILMFTCCLSMGNERSYNGFGWGERDSPLFISF